MRPQAREGFRASLVTEASVVAGAGFEPATLRSSRRSRRARTAPASSASSGPPRDRRRRAEVEGGAEWLRQAGVEVLVLDSSEGVELDFIARRPEVRNEGIGEQPGGSSSPIAAPRLATISR